MRIGGFQKTSLLDYPDYISAIIWTKACNFKCPFCYNKNIVSGDVEETSEEEILSFLKNRKGLLDGLVITGGEPLLQDDIIDFLQNVKKLKYLVKIDTNGSFPNMLEEIIDKKLVDYISMDVKAPKNKYNKLVGIKANITDIEKSIEIIRSKAPDYEFRTTFVPDLLKKEDIYKIAKWLKGSKRYYLQQFKSDIPLISENLENVTPYKKEEHIKIIDEIKPYFKNCDLRGV